MTVKETHLPPGVLGDVLFVRHQHDGDAFAVEVVKYTHDLFAGLAVEVAGRLVGKDQPWLVDQRPGNGHALLLAAGDAAGQGLRIAAEADLVEHLACALAPGVHIDAGVDQRQGDVVFKVHARQQVEALKDETDGLAAQAGEFVRLQAFDVAAIEDVVAAGGAVEAAKQVHEGRLAGAGGPHHCHELAAVDAQINLFEGGKQACGRRVGFAQALDPDDGRGCGFSSRLRHQNILRRTPLPEEGSAAGRFSPSTTRSPAFRSPPVTSVLRLSVMPMLMLTGLSWPSARM